MEVHLEQPIYSEFQRHGLSPAYVSAVRRPALTQAPASVTIIQSETNAKGGGCVHVQVGIAMLPRHQGLRHRRTGQAVSPQVHVASHGSWSVVDHKLVWELRQEGRQSWQGAARISINKGDMLQGAVERGTFLSADSRLAEEEGELQKNPTVFFVWQGHALRGNVPMETEIGKRRPQVLPFLREWVPWDAEQICDTGHLCQVIVVLIYVCQRSGGCRRPEDHEVVNPFEDWADLIRTEDFDTMLSIAIY